MLWKPGLGLHGYFVQRGFRHLSVIGGVGVGGGSIVWGAVMLEPNSAFFASPLVARLGIDLEAELRPHYLTARRMLGVAVNPRQTAQDELLGETAKAMGAFDTFGPTPNAIYFGEPGVDVADPFFGGEGPGRQGCRFCGGCLTGCPYGAKNSLYLNYLHFARRHGVQILSGRKADRIERLEGGGFVVELVAPGRGRVVQRLRARNVKSRRA